MSQVKIIFAGGFLGAGNTTLLLAASQNLIKRGKKTGLITNDQAPELVDSALLVNSGQMVEEVSGSCFCCNFKALVDAVQKYNADRSVGYIIAEPVGSCTDLSATIIQPLKQHWNDTIGVAPLSVVADPERLASVLDGGNAGLHEDAAYIFHKQLEESDIIVINKKDLLTSEQLDNLIRKTKIAYPDADVIAVSALTGDGVDAWLDEVISRNDAGKKLIEVDYDKYANGEAVLGWLNGTVELLGKTTDWDKFVTTMMTDLCARFEKDALPIGHVKAILESGAKAVVVNFTGNKNTLSVRGSVGSGDKCKITINARTETSPENLNAIVREVLNTYATGYTCTEVAWKYLMPGYPAPSYRFNKVV